MLCKGIKFGDELAVFHLSNMQYSQKGYRIPLRDGEALKLRNEFADGFSGELSDGLPPIRDADHRIKVLPNLKPPHRRLFQLSPTELVATKEYVSELIRGVKIRPSKSSYCTSLFYEAERKASRCH